MRFFSIVLLIISSTAALQVFSQTPTQQIDANSTYRLSNDFAGPGKALSVRSGAVVMADLADSPDQLWKIVAMGGGKYRLINVGAGDAKSLDNRKSGDQFTVVMGDTGGYTGQAWTLAPQSNGRYRLSNDYAGTGTALDSASMAAAGDFSGQYWTLTKSVPPTVIQVKPVPNISDPSKVVVPTIVGPGIDVTPQTTPSGTRANTGPELTYNTVIIPWDPTKIPKGGTMVCSADLRASQNCGTTKADWVGKHTVNTTCDKGFYDPIWGGTCWNFPDDDQNGTWVRGTNEVTADDAVWRAPKTETFANAKKVSTTAFAWDCKDGAFWDGWSGSGSGGAGCYTCPPDHPRRTGNPIYSSQACASVGNETAKAVFLQYNGCPKPDLGTMALTGKRIPGKPFLDIGGGGCYACPSADEEGNILVTERNGSPVRGDQGCTVKFKWRSLDFPEPGMSGLIGIKEVILQYFVLDHPDIITSYLTKEAQDKGGFKPGTAESQHYVEQQWQAIADHPYQSAALSSLMFGFLQTAAETDLASRTLSQRKLVASMEEYVKQRRTYIAEQALAMYDSWKQFDDKTRTQRLQSRLEVIGFDFGTVPLDFHSAALAGFGLGAAGAGALATIGAANLHGMEVARVFSSDPEAIKLTAEVVKAEKAYEAASAAKGAGRGFNTGSTIGGATRAQAIADAAKAEDVLNRARTALNARIADLPEISQGIRALTLTSRITVLGAAAIIDIVGAILTSIAIDQYMKIQEARPNLVKSLDDAKKPVDLKALLAAPNGNDQLAYFWSKAMDVKTVPDDPQLVAKARSTMELARQSGFQVSAGH
jgi:hypothetical protein